MFKLLSGVFLLILTTNGFCESSIEDLCRKNNDCYVKENTLIVGTDDDRVVYDLIKKDFKPIQQQLKVKLVIRTSDNGGDIYKYGQVFVSTSPPPRSFNEELTINDFKFDEMLIDGFTDKNGEIELNWEQDKATSIFIGVVIEEDQVYRLKIDSVLLSNSTGHKTIWCNTTRVCE